MTNVCVRYVSNELLFEVEDEDMYKVLHHMIFDNLRWVVTGFSNTSVTPAYVRETIPLVKKVLRSSGLSLLDENDGI